MYAIRKSIHRIILMLAICILGFIVIFSKKETATIPVPDQILIYKDGISHEVNQDSKVFSNIYKNCNEIRMQNTMESAIDEDIVTNVKSQIALEYVYSDLQILEMDGHKREYSKLLFNLEGKDNVILYDAGYNSGTYELDINKFLMKMRLQRILKKLPIGEEKEQEFESVLNDYIVESVNSRSKVYYCPDNYTYAYQIFDKDGAVLEEKKDITGSVYIEELAEGIVHVAISAGSYARNDVFYDTEKGIKSEIFYNVAAICKRKVVYMDLCSQEGCLIVRDIFDKDLYYQEIYKDFSPSAVPSAVLQSAVFVEDNILEVIYLEGKDYTEKKERIEL